MSLARTTGSNEARQSYLAQIGLIAATVVFTGAFEHANTPGMESRKKDMTSIRPTRFVNSSPIAVPENTLKLWMLQIAHSSEQLRRNDGT
jgi:hypothetical protein